MEGTATFLAIVGVLVIIGSLFQFSEKFIKKNFAWTSRISGVKRVATKDAIRAQKVLGIVGIILGVLTIIFSVYISTLTF